MSSYIFETVEFEKKYPVNAFVASIQSSSFHWHYEYEMLVVLKGSITVRVNSRILTLCREIGMSGKTMHRYLKSRVGLSVKEMLDTLKVDQAKKLLKHTEKNMNCIIDECGFGSENTFYRIFRQNTGLTPRKYRQRGLDLKTSQVLKGYLDYEEYEAEKIIMEILEEHE